MFLPEGGVTLRQHHQPPYFGPLPTEICSSSYSFIYSFPTSSSSPANTLNPVLFLGTDLGAGETSKFGT